MRLLLTMRLCIVLPLQANYLRVVVLLSVVALSACTTTPEPPKTLPDGFPLIAVGEWPDDGWKPFPMHTFAEQRKIRETNRHICEYTDKAECASIRAVLTR